MMSRSSGTCAGRPHSEPARFAAHLTALLEAAFDRAGTLHEAATSALARRGVRRADLQLAALAQEILRGTGLPLAGAGLVLAPDALADQAYWLEWWQPADDGEGFVRLPVQVDPLSTDFRDYTELAWYAVPRETGRRHVTGPYVDYLCTDQYTLTLTEPVWRAGVFVGVTGVDVLVRHLEAQLDLLEPTEPTLVLSSSGRVVTGLGTEQVTGDLVRDRWVAAAFAGDTSAARAAGWHVEPCPGLPFAVLTRPE